MPKWGMGMDWTDRSYWLVRLGPPLLVFRLRPSEDARTAEFTFPQASTPEDLIADDFAQARKLVARMDAALALPEGTPSRWSFAVAPLTHPGSLVISSRVQTIGILDLRSLKHPVFAFVVPRGLGHPIVLNDHQQWEERTPAQTPEYPFLVAELRKTMRYEMSLMGL